MPRFRLPRVRPATLVRAYHAPSLSTLSSHTRAFHTTPVVLGSRPLDIKWLQKKAQSGQRLLINLTSGQIQAARDLGFKNPVRALEVLHNLTVDSIRKRWSPRSVAKFILEQDSKGSDFRPRSTFS